MSGDRPQPSSLRSGGPERSEFDFFLSTAGALSTFYPDAKQVLDPEVRRRQIVRIIAQIPILAAWSHRHLVGKPYVSPDANLGYTANFLSIATSSIWRARLGSPSRRCA
mgnify:CR=1 FL=1